MGALEELFGKTAPPQAPSGAASGGGLEALLGPAKPPEKSVLTIVKEKVSEDVGDLGKLLLGLLGGVKDIGVGAGKAMFNAATFDTKGMEEGIEQLSGPIKTLGAGALGIGKTAVVDPAAALIDSLAGIPEFISLVPRLSKEIIDAVNSGEDVQAILNKKIKLTPAETQALIELEETGKGSMETASSFAGLIPTPAAQFASGLSGNFLEGQEKGLSNKENLTRSVTGGTERAAMIYFLNKFFGKKPSEKALSRTKAKLTGLSNDDINAAKDIGQSNPNAAKEIMAQAERKIAGGRKILPPLELSGKNFNQFLDDIGNMTDDAGKKLGAAADDLTGRMSTETAKAELQKFLESANVGISGKKLIFKGSDFASRTLGTDRALMQEAWIAVSKPSIPLRDALSLMRSWNNSINVSSATGAISSSQVGLIKTIDALRSGLYAIKGTYKELAGKYADLIGFSTEAAKLTKEGLRSPELLRRLFGNAPSVAKDLLKQADDIAQKYQIASGKGLYEHANFALSSENAVGYVGATSLKGQVPTGNLDALITVIRNVADELPFVEQLKKLTGFSAGSQLMKFVGNKSIGEWALGDLIKTKLGSELAKVLGGASAIYAEKTKEVSDKNVGSDQLKSARERLEQKYGLQQGAAPSGDLDAAKERLRQKYGLQSSVPQEEKGFLSKVKDFFVPSAMASDTIGEKKVTAQKDFMDRLIAANNEMVASGKGFMQINQSFRSNEQQRAIRAAKGYTSDSEASGSGGRPLVAPPGNSLHEKGLAVDITNWEDAVPFLAKHGIINGLKGDMGHFSLESSGEIKSGAPKTSALDSLFKVPQANASPVAFPMNQPQIQQPVPQQVKTPQLPTATKPPVSAAARLLSPFIPEPMKAVANVASQAMSQPKAAPPAPNFNQLFRESTVGKTTDKLKQSLKGFFR